MTYRPRSSFLCQDLIEPLALPAESGLGVLVSNRSIDKELTHADQMNEDAAGFWELDATSVVLAIADGLGGGPSGAEASAIAIRALAAALRDVEAGQSARSAIVDAFEKANADVLDLGIGAGTTLVVVEVREGVARAFHAGDSIAMLVGQRGRVGFETTAHSPVGYAMAAGVLDPDDAHHHKERHILSNCIGSREMRVEVGAPTSMAALDTLVLATDGITDNVKRQTLIDLVRVGPLTTVAENVRSQAHAAMEGKVSGLPAHPDDATLLLFRRSREK